MRHPDFNDVAVVGMHFRGADVKALVANFIPPMTLTLVREPDNQYDAFAVKVLHNGIHIGYIEATAACFLAPHMDDGCEYTCTVVDMQARKNNLHPICNLTPKEA